MYSQSNLMQEKNIIIKAKPECIPILFTDGVYCNRTIDGMGGCWPDTLPGTYARIQCPDIPVFNQNGNITETDTEHTKF